jgi:predicted O-methyltransferase YrrM
VQYAGLASKVTILLGPAVKSLSELPSEEPFDLAFIDADKPNNTNYFREAERLVKPGGVIIVDNVVRRGRVADLSIREDENVEGARELLRYIQGNDAVEATTIATVGSKGYDGFLYAIRKE